MYVSVKKVFAGQNGDLKDSFNLGSGKVSERRFCGGSKQSPWAIRWKN